MDNSPSPVRPFSLAAFTALKKRLVPVLLDRVPYERLLPTRPLPCAAGRHVGSQVVLRLRQIAVGCL